MRHRALRSVSFCCSPPRAAAATWSSLPPPKPTVNWAAVPIVSPIAGTIELTREEFAGRQIVIRSTSQPAFSVVIFHVNPSIGLADGTPLAPVSRSGRTSAA